MTVALGVDVGTVRVGLAASDPSGSLASPVASLPARDPEAVWRRIAEESRTREATHLVVGLPRRLDGGEGEAAAAARRFGSVAAERCGLRVEYFDERFSTVQAERTLIQQGVRRQRRRQSVDAHAAALVLQGWLDARRLAPRGSAG
ncbi:MAG: Holliday junction resolvase RuvX [Candidatus Dormibacteria bacterium]